MPPRLDPPNTSLLSPGGYDDDASSLRSLSEQDSDSEDDEFLSKSRTTVELAEHDRAVLDDEEELEKLLTRGGPAHGLRRIFSPNGSSVKIGKLERNRRRRRRKELQDRMDETGELMFEMEEGYRESESSTPSSELDRPTQNEYSHVQPQRLSWRRLALIFSAISILFFIFLLGAYKASTQFRASHSPRPLLSNGTALFAPTTILLSLDGFRADYLNRGLTPTLNALIAAGVSPQYMLPSFPSATFPNHFTVVTGLYPESHGIVANTFWDPVLQEEFHNTQESANLQSKWWTAEPLWLTAEKQGVRTAIHMWPGSEAHIGGIDPTYLDKFDGREVLSRKVNRVLELLDLPGTEDESHVVSERPQFIAAYVPNVDADGHNYGPNSTEMQRALTQVDDMLANLLSGLQERNLTEIVNIVITSDHGMATTDNERLVQLDDLIDLNLVERIDGWPLRGIRPKKPEDLEKLQDQLENMLVNYSHAVEVYTRETMPERYHFSNNDRIAPLWVIPKPGWAIVERPEFDVQDAIKTGKAYHPKGIHGYDHEHPLMRAIFIARGPAFPHSPNSRVEAFQNTNVYNILCDSLGINPLPNNGTLRLPLQPVGLHSDEGVSALDTPSDPPVSATTSIIPSETSTMVLLEQPTPSSPESEPQTQPESDKQGPEDPTKQPENNPENQDEQSPESTDDNSENGGKQDHSFLGGLWNSIVGTAQDIGNFVSDLADDILG